MEFGLIKAKSLKCIAETSFSISFAKNAFSFQIKQLIQQIIFIENQIEDLEKQISILLSKTNQVISTISGISKTLGAIIISKICDIYRFDSPPKLVVFAGLDVKVNQSGEFSGSKKIFRNVVHNILGALFGLLQAELLFVIPFCLIIASP